jgi:hypothetical protein
MAAVLSTASVPQAERFEYWRQIAGDLLGHEISMPEHLLGNIFVSTFARVRDIVDRVGPVDAVNIANALISLLAGALGSIPQAQVRKPKHMEAYHRERILAARAWAMTR